MNKFYNVKIRKTNIYAEGFLIYNDENQISRGIFACDLLYIFANHPTGYILQYDSLAVFPDATQPTGIGFDRKATDYFLDENFIPVCYKSYLFKNDTQIFSLTILDEILDPVKHMDIIASIENA